jgi:hypothetical protein
MDRSDYPSGGLSYPGHSGVPQGPLDPIQFTPEMLSLILQMQGGQRPDAADAIPINRGAWSQGEDDLLASGVRRFGSKKWTDIAKLVPNRTAKQCRERWCNRLAPTVRHEPFEAWEDQIIVEKQRELGNRWSAIARQLQGRSANAVKNRWYSGLKNVSEAGGRGMGDPGQPLYHEELGSIAGTGFSRGDYRDNGPLGGDL